MNLRLRVCRSNRTDKTGTIEGFACERPVGCTLARVERLIRVFTWARTGRTRLTGVTRVAGRQARAGARARVLLPDRTGAGALGRVCASVNPGADVAILARIVRSRLLGGTGGIAVDRLPLSVAASRSPDQGWIPILAHDVWGCARRSRMVPVGISASAGIVGDRPCAVQACRLDGCAAVGLVVAEGRLNQTRRPVVRHESWTQDRTQIRHRVPLAMIGSILARVPAQRPATASRCISTDQATIQAAVSRLYFGRRTGRGGGGERERLTGVVIADEQDIT